MDHKKAIAALTVMMMAFISLSVVTADESDAYVTIEDDIKAYGFTNNGNGTLEILFKSSEANDTMITIVVTLVDSGDVVAREDINIPPGEYVATLNFKITSIGDHEILITCEPVGMFPSPGGISMNTQKLTIVVTESIWSKWTTFAAIGIIVLLIAIAAFIKMRNAPATKPDITFTQLERQKDKEDDDRQETPRTTQRRRYEESTPAPKKEAKPASFTELEKQKSEPVPIKEPVKEVKKEPTKKANSEPPKKLKYVSSRRK